MGMGVEVGVYCLLPHPGLRLDHVLIYRLSAIGDWRSVRQDPCCDQRLEGSSRVFFIHHEGHEDKAEDTEEKQADSTRCTG